MLWLSIWCCGVLLPVNMTVSATSQPWTLDCPLTPLHPCRAVASQQKGPTIRCVAAPRQKWLSVGPGLLCRLAHAVCAWHVLRHRTSCTHWPACTAVLQRSVPLQPPSVSHHIPQQHSFLGEFLSIDTYVLSSSTLCQYIGVGKLAPG
jgi:hypothetical protein